MLLTPADRRWLKEFLHAEQQHLAAELKRDFKLFQMMFYELPAGDPIVKEIGELWVEWDRERFDWDNGDWLRWQFKRVLLAKRCRQRIC
jgi:hypothetical protein